MVSAGLVIILCIIAAGLAVAGGAAMHRVSARREYSESVAAPSELQHKYMRKVRLKKWPGLRDEERLIETTSTRTGITTMQGSGGEV
jgi:hypothetical protein